LHVFEDTGELFLKGLLLLFAQTEASQERDVLDVFAGDSHADSKKMRQRIIPVSRSGARRPAGAWPGADFLLMTKKKRGQPNGCPLSRRENVGQYG
jgi:hypothetical protein